MPPKSAPQCRFPKKTVITIGAVAAFVALDAMAQKLSGHSILDTINNLPGILAGNKPKPDRAKMNYMTDDQMRTVMQTFTDTLGAERPIVALSIGRDLATVLPADQGRMEIRLDKPNQYEGSGKKGLPGVPLSSLDPQGVRDKLVALSGCTAPSGLAIGTTATGRMQYDLLCAYKTPQEALYTMLDGEDKLLPERDLRSAEGVIAAWEDMLKILPPETPITMWGITFSYPGGQLLANGGGYTTLRPGTREGHDSPLLGQAYIEGWKPPKNFVRVRDITPDVVRKGLAALQKKCGGDNRLSLLSLQVGRDRGAFFSFMTEKGCILETKLNVTPH